MQVLIVDDDPTSRTILQAVLEKWNYKARLASDGIEAWNILQEENSPRMLLLDWMMPEMDGPALCRKIREELGRESFYILMLTARDSRKDLIMGLESGADDYIGKPWDNEELKARLNVGRRILQLQNESSKRQRLQGVLEMAGAVCHELNQPLQVVSGYTEMLITEIEKDSAIRESLEKILEGVEKMGNLTSKLMQITDYQTRGYLDGKLNIIDIEKSAKDKITLE